MTKWEKCKGAKLQKILLHKTKSKVKGQRYKERLFFIILKLCAGKGTRTKRTARREELLLLLLLLLLPLLLVSALFLLLHR